MNDPSIAGTSSARGSHAPAGRGGEARDPAESLAAAERARALIERLKARDGAALAELYDLYGATVYALALRVVRLPAEAEEVTQEVFLYAWEKAATFDHHRGAVATWLGTMARSRGIDRLRQRQSQQRRRDGLQQEIAAEEGVPQRLPDHDTALGEISRRVRSALTGLPDEQRQVIEIAYFDGLSQSEIAELLKTPLGTVKTRMRQGMIKLRAMMSAIPGLAESQ